MTDHSAIAGGAERATFMARVRTALGDPDARRSVAPPPDVDEAIVRTTAEDADRIERFVDRARNAGMEVHRLQAGELADQVITILERLDCRSVTIGLTDAAAEIRRRLESSNITIVDWRSSPGLETHYDVDAGITDTVGAIAESGTIVVASSPGHSRGTFLVPPIHIAIVRAQDIVPDLIDCWKRHGESREDPPAATVLITGPSKTADIEGILITGVHGPREVHVVLVEATGRSSDETTEGPRAGPT